MNIYIPFLNFSKIFVTKNRVKWLQVIKGKYESIH
jgi:hypothetical protein